MAKNRLTSRLWVCFRLVWACTEIFALGVMQKYDKKLKDLMNNCRYCKGKSRFFFTFISSFTLKPDARFPHLHSIAISACWDVSQPHQFPWVHIYPTQILNQQQTRNVYVKFVSWHISVNINLY